MQSAYFVRRQVKRAVITKPRSDTIAPPYADTSPILESNGEEYVASDSQSTPPNRTNYLMENLLSSPYMKSTNTTSQNNRNKIQVRHLTTLETRLGKAVLSKSHQSQDICPTKTAYHQSHHLSVPLIIE